MTEMKLMIKLIITLLSFVKKLNKNNRENVYFYNKYPH